MDKLFSVIWVSGNGQCISVDHPHEDLIELIESFAKEKAPYSSPINALITEGTERTGSISFNSGKASLLAQIDRMRITEQLVFCPIKGSLDVYIVRRLDPRK